MSEQPITFKYKKGLIEGGYSFTIRSNVITLPEYIERLENPGIQEALQYEAQKAHYHYVNEVNRQKKYGEKVNSFIAKQDATKRAKDEARIKYEDIWQEVEDAQKAARIYAIPNHDAPHDNAINNQTNTKFIVAINDLNDSTKLVLYEGTEITIRLVCSDAKAIH